jgi:magnesium transporter
MSNESFENLNESSTPLELVETWSSKVPEERESLFRAMNRTDAEDVFLQLNSSEQVEVLGWFSTAEKRSWVRLLEPDDAADLVQEMEDSERYQTIALMDEATFSRTP